MNSGPAAELGVGDGDWVRVSSSRASGEIRAFVSEEKQ
ncbi:MAG: molybdopterin dinucleotide binding domain-containing protein [Thermodesulfobacteriota bacterium]